MPLPPMTTRRRMLAVYVPVYGFLLWFFWWIGGPRTVVVVAFAMPLIIASFFSLVSLFGSWSWRRLVLSLLSLIVVYFALDWSDSHLSARPGSGRYLIPRRVATPPGRPASPVPPPPSVAVPQDSPPTE